MFRGREDEKLLDINITREEVISEVSKLKIGKSPGPDEMYPRVLKECKDKISITLTDIFNRSGTS